MKIEKVNENQIRCTLTREDLASRELKISELCLLYTSPAIISNIKCLAVLARHFVLL